MADRIIYKNHCTPQEKITFAVGERWYLDSDSGRKLTGTGESQSTSINTPVTGTWSTNVTVSSCKFIYVKNTDTSGSDYLTLNIGSMGVGIKLSPGESFASDVDNGSGSAVTVVIGGSGTPDYEYIKGA
jgi:hypothetical protein